MKIRNQIALVGIVVYSIVFMITILIIRPEIIKRFENTEIGVTHAILNTIKNSIEDTKSNFDFITNNWVHTDAIYKFTESQNPEYIEKILTPDTIKALNIAAAFIVDNQNRLIYSRFYSSAKKRSTALQSRIAEKLLDINRNTDEGTGFTKIDDSVILVSIKKILPGTEDKKSYGKLILLRFIDKSLFNSLENIKNKEIKFLDMQLSKKIIDSHDFKTLKQEIFIQPFDENTLKGYIILKSPDGSPHILVEAPITRSIYKTGLKTTRCLTFIVSIVIIFLLISGIITYELFATPRYRSIIDSIKTIESSGDFSKKIPFTPYDRKFNDEITDIKNYLNKFLSIIDLLTEKQNNINKNLEIEIERRTRKIVKEIENRKLVENKLKESEELFRKMAENVQDGIMIIEDHKIKFVNKKYLDIFGFTYRDLTLENFWKSIPEEEIQNIKEFFRKARQNKLQSNEINLWITRKNGDRRYIHGTYYPNIENGVVKRRYITLTDITSQKRSEERYRLVVDNAHESILVVQDKNIKFFNRTFIEKTGYLESDVIDANIFKFVSPDDLNVVKSSYEVYVSTGVFPEVIFRLKKRDNNYLWIKANAVRILWEDKPAALVFLNDITAQKIAEEEKRRLTEQINQMQKLSAIQNLAGGIAHDLNNILTPIIGYSDLAKLKINNKNRVVFYMNEIKSSAIRAAELVRKLLAFSRKQILQKRYIDLNSVINELKEMFNRLIQENISINYSLSENLPVIYADKNQIEQIIINLIVNAKDAMPMGGTINVTTKTVTIEENPQDKDLEANPGDYVCLTVSDTGIGMDDDTINKIFEPFFTTKSFGFGYGLGLSMVYGIVKQHNGFIKVDSCPGKGSSFSICFPSAGSEKKFPDETENELKIDIDGKGKNILIIEDEKSIRSFTASLLKNSNFNVIEFENAEDAYEKIVSGLDISLIIVDIILPGITGLELLDKLYRENYRIPFILVSGYSEDFSKYKILEGTRSLFLRKPYTINELLTAINNILQ